MKTLRCHIVRLLTGYNEKRHFLDHSLDVAPVWDFSAFVEKLIFRLTKVGYRPTWKSFFFRPFDPRVFLGFNTIRIDGGPFLVFFETTSLGFQKNDFFLFSWNVVPFRAPIVLASLQSLIVPKTFNWPKTKTKQPSRFFIPHKKSLLPKPMTDDGLKLALSDFAL